MSSPPPPAPVPSEVSDPQLPEAFHYTPDEEKYVLQADALRHRQLRSALLYGSSRYWRRRQRVWPAVVFGVVVTALVCGVIALIGAFGRQQEVNEERGFGQTRSQSVQPFVPESSLLPNSF
ncbi:hypothetical protein DFP74_1915 [Nocardiopsis sp. Huas11]|uniref:hypothetical protein n=1 Tax=Nocardiopsis sp. Huas11 TaxID=2183912 RepID=UPI000EAF25AE|nr:hypothetical protein [Nocardiopsis sp. Huas11]RKS06287.1 hypothetical protein DFP74_1915 [Nocardiopsis sp. Huas11]